MRYSIIMIFVFVVSCNSPYDKSSGKQVSHKTSGSQNPIIGTWTLDSTNLSDNSIARLPSYCNDLKVGSKFNFNTDSTLKVVPKDSIKECYTYSYKVRDSILGLLEYDMVLQLDIIERTAKSMVLKSRYMPDHTVDRERGYVLYLSKMEGEDK